MRNAHKMQKLARLIERECPDMAFFLLVAPFGHEADCDYVANCQRQDAIAMMKEFIIRNGAHEDWIDNLLSKEAIRDKMRESGEL